MRRLSTLLLIGLVLGRPASARAEQRELFAFHGSTAAEYLGDSVAGVGDVDRDGYADFLIGASGADADRGLARVHSGRDGAVLFLFRGDAAGDRFGRSAAGGGDVDGDGVPDFLVGALGGGPLGNGYVRVLSGRTGTILYTLDAGLAGGLEFAWSLANAGDVDGDGHADVLVGTRRESVAGVFEAGRVRVFSGADGSLLYAFAETGPFHHLGQAVSGAGDVDADGFADFLIAAPFADSPTANGVGRAAVVSGRDGTLLHDFFGPPGGLGTRFGRAVAAAGDVDLDGFDDLLVGAILDASQGFGTGKVHVLSGRDGTPLFGFEGTGAGQFFGLSVDGVGDVDGDGHPDLALAGAGAAPFDFPSQVRSGRDGSLLFEFKTVSIPDRGSLRRVGDVNRDGYADLIVGEPLASENAALAGRVRVLSGRSLSLATDTHRISIATGGAQTFRLDAGRSHAGKRYALLGSASGTRPGLPLGLWTLPLNLDLYTVLTLRQPGRLMLDSVGTLDEEGRATASFELGAAVLAAGTAGTVLDHAYLVVGVGGIEFVSNPVPLRLED